MVYRRHVRTNIEIDDDLLAEAQRVAQTPTKKATVEYALRELVRRKGRRQILTLRGRVDWEGDLEGSRLGR
jgi:Arc/MetJ family transcription regulator